MGLNAQQERFVAEYMIDLNATQAAIRAGYSQKTAAIIGHENLRKPNIEAAIQAARKAQINRLEIRADRVLMELARIGLSDIRKTMDGVCLKRAEEMDDDTAAAISSIKVKTVSLGEGEVDYITEIKLWDKCAALDKLARHLGIYEKDNAQANSLSGLTEVLNRRRQARAARRRSAG